MRYSLQMIFPPTPYSIGMATSHVESATRRTWGTSYHQCRIDSVANNNFTELHYFELFGLRILSVYEDKSLSLNSWLRELVTRRGQLVQINCALRDGKPAIQVLLTLPIGDQITEDTLWLDPEKNLMVTEMDYETRYPGGYVRSSHRVIESKLLSGIWVPVKTVRTGELSGHENKTEWVYDVTGFDLGSVQPSDVEVNFPLNSKVVDTIKHIAYFIRPGEQFDLLPLADTSAHLIHRPPAERRVDKIDSDTSKLYTTNPLIVDPLANATGRSARIKLRIISGLLTIATLVGLLAVWRRKGFIRLMRS